MTASHVNYMHRCPAVEAIILISHIYFSKALAMLK